MAEPDAPGGASASTGTPEEPATTTAAKGGLRQLTADEFSFADAVGGVRGLIESTAPGLVFVVVFLVAGQVSPAVVAAIGVAVVAVVIRLVQRTPATQAFSGTLGVGIGAIWAARTGEAENFYLWGLIVNTAWFLGALVSLLVRYPVVGVIVSLLRNSGMAWRTAGGAAAVHLRRRYAWATWLWVGVFGARLAVQVPVFLRGEELIGWLATAKLAMGVPLFALGLWLTWLLVASPAARAEQEDQPPTPPR